MEELLEMITWAQLGIHKKTVVDTVPFTGMYLYKKIDRYYVDDENLDYFLQVGLLNVDGYYNNLLAFFDTGVEEGFIKQGACNIVVSAPSARELMEKMEVPKTLEICMCFEYLKNTIVFSFWFMAAIYSFTQVHCFSPKLES